MPLSTKSKRMTLEQYNTEIPRATRSPPFERGARGDLLTAGYGVDDRVMADLVPSPRCCLNRCFSRAFMADSMTWSLNAGSGANVLQKGSLAASAPPNWLMISLRTSSILPTLRMARQRIKQHLGFLQIGGIKTLGEPAVDRGQQLVCVGTPALALPQPAQARPPPAGRAIWPAAAERCRGPEGGALCNRSL